jgi:hypothetical protein
MISHVRQFRVCYIHVLHTCTARECVIKQAASSPAAIEGANLQRLAESGLFLSRSACKAVPLERVGELLALFCALSLSLLRAAAPSSGRLLLLYCCLPHGRHTHRHRHRHRRQQQHNTSRGAACSHCPSVADSTLSLPPQDEPSSSERRLWMPI